MKGVDHHDVLCGHMGPCSTLIFEQDSHFSITDILFVAIVWVVFYFKKVWIVGVEMKGIFAMNHLDMGLLR